MRSISWHNDWAFLFLRHLLAFYNEPGHGDGHERSAGTRSCLFYVSWNDLQNTISASGLNRKKNNSSESATTADCFFNFNERTKVPVLNDEMNAEMLSFCFAIFFWKVFCILKRLYDIFEVHVIVSISVPGFVLEKRTDEYTVSKRLFFHIILRKIIVFFRKALLSQRVRFSLDCFPERLWGSSLQGNKRVETK